MKSRPERSRALLVLASAAAALALALLFAAQAGALFFQTIPTLTPAYTLPPIPSPTSSAVPDTPGPPGPTALPTPGTPMPPGQTSTPPGPTPFATLPEPTGMTPGSQSALVLTKLVSQQAVLPGDQIQFTIWVTNTGQAVATGVILRDVLDPMIELLRVGSSDGTAEVQGQTLLLHLGMLEPGQVTLTVIEARVSEQSSPGQIILNQASVYFDGGQAHSEPVAVALPPDVLPATGADRRLP